MSQPAPAPALEPNVTVPEGDQSVEDQMLAQLDDIPDPEPEPDPEPQADPEPEPDAEPEPEPDAEPEPDDDEPAQINSLADMAKAYDLSESALAEHLTVPGPDGDVPLADVLKAFRDAPNAVAISEAVTAKTQELDTQIHANKQLHEAKLVETQDALERLLAESRSEPEPNWKQLEENDPQEYARQHIRYSRRQEAMRQAHQNLLNAAAEREKTAATEQEKWAAGEVKTLEAHSDMADWVGDQKLAARELKGMDEYLVSRGFKEGDPDLQMMRDHRVVLIVRDAMRQSGLSGKLQKGAKKLRVAKKGIIEPQARADDQDSDRQRRSASLKRHEEAGTVGSAAAAFMEMGDL